MKLFGLTEHLLSDRTFKAFSSQLKTQQQINVIKSARPFFIASLAQTQNKSIIVITDRAKRAYDISEQLAVWLEDEERIFRYMAPLPKLYEHAPWGESVIQHRIETLNALMDDDRSAAPIVVTSARALLQRTMPANLFRKNCLNLSTGDRFVLHQLLKNLHDIGYEHTTLVNQAGTFSRRGGVVDIFPLTAEHPYRIEYFDDVIDSIRAFDLNTQRSITSVQSIKITPAREALPTQLEQTHLHLQSWFESLSDDNEILKDYNTLKNATHFPTMEFYLPYIHAQPISLLDYAPLDSLIIIENIQAFNDTVEQIITDAEEQRQALETTGHIPPNYNQPYLTLDQLQASMSDFEYQIEFVQDVAPFAEHFKPAERFGGQLKSATSNISQLVSNKHTVLTISQQTQRIRDLWQEQHSDGFLPVITDLPDKSEAGSLYLINDTLQEGWTLKTSESHLHLITDAELFGWNRPEPRRRNAKPKTRSASTEYNTWSNGDYVVHVDYGIGQFSGLNHRTIDGIAREYLVVEYANNDTLFVPIHQADRLTRYIGTSDKAPTLNRLGKPDWEKVRSKAKKSIQEEAEELLSLYAQRAKIQGFAFSPDDHWQHELEASFPFVETEDQAKAVNEIKSDMENQSPMDRLICGDVGYGKTEVALRAAFKAVNDGKQVVVLVPTTILAQQHFETFSSRLRPFPVKVELMSRFRNKEHQQRILPKIASGEVDILIGTHRILSSDITIPNLGLIIIDEEQRFGVKQKEHFKRLRTQVDILTMTATPIPRTLYMSLTGVRDISMIQTPPEERLPIKTHVGRTDENLMRQAITREIDRGGQVFVVHNRVRTLPNLAEKLEELVPEARIITAHGQMNEQQLEKIMSAFAHGEFDVLLSTSIIENGIDIPNANTLIVDRADWFGLSQLYQLRGRVGRGAQQAYAYFFYHPTGRLTEEARARLTTLSENTGLGSGYQIAMRDLEIRGAGDILSTRQTGHVASIGLHLYTQLLSQTVKKLKGEPVEKSGQAVSQNGIVLNLPVPAYIPETWIDDLPLRLSLYQRIGSLSNHEEIQQMREELTDRFGAPPPAVEGLLYQMSIKLWAIQVKATGVIVLNDQIQIKLPYLATLNRTHLEQQLPDEVSVTRTAVVIPYDTKADDSGWKDLLIQTLKLLSANTQIQILETESL